MKKRKIYYRKMKDKTFIIEGKQKGKTVYILSLPKSPEKLIRFLAVNLGFPKNMENNEKRSLFFTKEKYDKIVRKILSLDYKIPKGEDET